MISHKDLPAEAGIYKITHNVSGRSYVGSSKNIRQRAYEHIRTLNKSQHHSRYLQRCWNKYGADSFTFEVIELCTESDLLVQEQYYMDTMLPEYNMTKVAGSPEGATHSEEAKLANSLRAKSWWVIPGNRERIVAAKREYFKQEDSREKAREAALQYNKDHPEKGQNHSVIMKSKFEDPEFHKAFCEKMSESMTEDRKTRLSNIGKSKWQDPEYRLKNCAITDEEAVQVLLLKREGLKHREIAEIIGCVKSVVDNISCGATYRHIDRNTLEVVHSTDLEV